MARIGKYAFILGLIIAVVVALVTQLGWIAWVLAVLGLVVGFLNVTSEETRRFLLAVIGLMLAATSVQVVPYVGDVITRIVSNLVVFIAPAILVVALKSLFETVEDRAFSSQRRILFFWRLRTNLLQTSPLFEPSRIDILDEEYFLPE